MIEQNDKIERVSIRNKSGLYGIFSGVRMSWQQWVESCGHIMPVLLLYKDNPVQSLISGVGDPGGRLR